ncbi:hypothetical protein D8B26_002853 [Coccidioides posadasii str. Silveira]|uniref:uncharacterized protein n=1 Tax=Coccidioides posadasii (strain RMSCC 757 / Silveira) TaxID=443226 RepID=UPI001BF0FD5E|nr:hypothetical protein D8B26_002853 [Coccidioides posadasii str. Silveira]
MYIHTYNLSIQGTSIRRHSIPPDDIPDFILYSVSVRKCARMRLNWNILAVTCHSIWSYRKITATLLFDTSLPATHHADVPPRKDGCSALSLPRVYNLSGPGHPASRVSLKMR